MLIVDCIMWQSHNTRDHASFDDIDVLMLTMCARKDWNERECQLTLQPLHQSLAMFEPIMFNDNKLCYVSH